MKRVALKYDTDEDHRQRMKRDRKCDFATSEKANCLHFCSLAYDLPNRSSGRIYELNARVERAD